MCKSFCDHEVMTTVIKKKKKKSHKLGMVEGDPGVLFPRNIYIKWSFAVMSSLRFLLLFKKCLILQTDHMYRMRGLHLKIEGNEDKVWFLT